MTIKLDLQTIIKVDIKKKRGGSLDEEALLVKKGKNNLSQNQNGNNELFVEYFSDINCPFSFATLIYWQFSCETL